MFELVMKNWSLDEDLQIVHADVLLTIGKEVIIDQPLCVDVGLPALLLSIFEDIKPNQWSPPENWERMPFFVCGCGDPDCRGFSFTAKHEEPQIITLTEIEEREDDDYREFGSYSISIDVYAQQVSQAAKQFLVFIENKNYHPYLQETLPVIRRLVNRVDQEYPQD